MIYVLISGFCLILLILGTILYISPAGTIGAHVMIGIFYIWHLGLHGVSLSKVLMFETPENPFSTSDSSLSSKSSKKTGVISSDYSTLELTTTTSTSESV